MTITIVPKLVGGVGNRLFQLAAARHVAIATGSELALSATFAGVNAHGHDPENNWYFRHVARLPTDSDAAVVTVAEHWGEKPEGLVIRIKRALENLNPTQSAIVLLRGYFQGEAYLSSPSEAATIKDWFTWPGAIEEMNSSESMRYAVHVRRSDYVGHKYHEVLIGDDQLHSYYREAATRFPKDAPFAVFSDDIDWCRAQFKKEQDLVDRAHFVSADLGAFQSLQLMSRCSLGTVMANSSFSWWAAWLNTNPEKTVTMPSRWFGPNAKIDGAPLYKQGSYVPVIIDV